MRAAGELLISSLFRVVTSALAVIALCLDFFVRYALLDFLFRFFNSVRSIYRQSLSYIYDFIRAFSQKESCNKNNIGGIV